MNIKPIKTKADYRAALKDVEALMGAKANTPGEERLDVMVTLIEAYERKHFPLELPDPVAGRRGVRSPDAPRRKSPWVEGRRP